MSLLDEATALTKPTQGAKCGICQWLGTLDPDTRADFDEAFAAPVGVAGHSAIVEALENRGYTFSVHQVTNHRKRHAWKANGTA